MKQLQHCKQPECKSYAHIHAARGRRAGGPGLKRQGRAGSLCKASRRQAAPPAARPGHLGVGAAAGAPADPWNTLLTVPQITQAVNRPCTLPGPATARAGGSPASARPCRGFSTPFQPSCCSCWWARGWPGRAARAATSERPASSAAHSAKGNLMVPRELVHA